MRTTLIPLDKTFTPSRNTAKSTFHHAFLTYRGARSNQRYWSFGFARQETNQHEQLKH
jgi:hypothetical protein